MCVVAQESQASALRCLQDSLQKHNTTLTVTYSATLHDREIRFGDFTVWSWTISDFVCFVCASVWQCAHIGALSVCVCVLSLCVTWCVSVSADVLQNMLSV